MVNWFKLFRGRGKKTGSHSATSQHYLAPVPEIVEQGMLVARVAIRMTVKNEIIMNALKRDIDYDSEKVAVLVRNAISELVDERLTDAANTERTIAGVKKRGWSGSGDSEYGVDDTATLQHRKEVYEGVAAQLRKWAEDDAVTRSIGNSALELAWQEIGDSLKTRAAHPYYGGGKTSEYQRTRDTRIRDLIDNDLADLARAQQEKTSQSAENTATEPKKSRWRAGAKK
ncbi:MAG: asparagine synthase [Microbacteriaceae bacterium]|nr:asparagine synthase [Microbacteriaceae bacterium]